MIHTRGLQLMTRRGTTPSPMSSLGTRTQAAIQSTCLIASSSSESSLTIDALVIFV